MREMRRKYVFTGKLELKSAMHIGGGQINLRGTDSPVVLTPEGDPFIPGSSFKGVFRSTVEKLVGAIPNRITCSLFEGKCPTANQDDFNSQRRNGNWNEAKLVNILDKELCDTCKLFGSPFAASKIFFSDLYVDEWAEATQVRDGVAIDRDSERAVDRLKYDYEVVSADSTFEMEIVLEDPSDTDLRLACVGLNELVSGMLGIGGMRSRGLGNCQLIGLTGYELDLTDINQLHSYLVNTTLEDKMTKVDDMNGFLEERIGELF
jgi:CRISPR-associated RAMP protein (TIGR02581 family)